MPRLTDQRVATIQPPTRGQAEHSDDLVTGLRLRVGAGGRKAWIVRTRAGGKPINKTLGSYPALKLADARDVARGLLTQIAKEGLPKPKKTFGEVTELFPQLGVFSALSYFVEHSLTLSLLTSTLIYP